MHYINSTPNESNWAEEEEEAAGQRLMCMVFITAAAKRCKKNGMNGQKEAKEMYQEAP